MKDKLTMISPFEQVLEDLRKGRLVLLVDDSLAFSSVYLVGQASSITAEDICVMVNHGGGLICGALDEDRLKELGLPPMCSEPNCKHLDFMVSVEARQGVTTGISASDRARTLRTLANTNSAKRDLLTPGHIFPIRTRQGGVLVRNSYAEASVDLMRLSGAIPVAALCQCLTEKGELANSDDLPKLSKNTGLHAIRISDIIHSRLASEFIIEELSHAQLPTQEAGTFLAYCFRSITDGAEHLALVKGNLDKKDSDGRQTPVLVRVQAENRIGDLLGTQDVMSRQHIREALDRIHRADRGVLVYIRHQAGPMTNTLHISGYNSTDTNSQLREYGIGAQILNYLGVTRVDLLTNSARDISGISAFKIEIVRRNAF